jgi:hypothetical protein
MQHKSWDYDAAHVYSICCRRPVQLCYDVVYLMVGGVEAHEASTSLNAPPPLTYAGFECEHPTRI